MGNAGEFYFWEAGENFRFSQNFRSGEFECPMAKVNFISVELIQKLEFVRAIVGVPLKINEGYRTEAYQQHLRDQGYKTSTGVSQHQLGRAADISLRGLTDTQKASLIKCLEKEFKAIGYANTFIHVDLRDDKHRSWSY